MELSTTPVTTLGRTVKFSPSLDLAVSASPEALSPSVERGFERGGEATTARYKLS